MLKRKVLVSCLMVSLFAVTSLFLTACKDVNGGGYIEKENGGKVTFGFQMKCDTDENGNANVTGQVQFHDHDENMKIHAVPDAVPDGQCADSESEDLPAELLGGNNEISYTGTYTPRPEKLGPGGKFTVTVTDTGATGKDKGDTFEISLNGGIYDGYHLKGNLKGGNIKSKE